MKMMKMRTKKITECRKLGHPIIKLTIYEFYMCLILISVVLHLIIPKNMSSLKIELISHTNFEQNEGNK